jgi:ribonucleotide reductase beta subunit family protein with ferritin-like domain
MEPLEDPNNFRYTMFPLEHLPMFQMYKKSQSYFWTEDVANSLLAKDAIEFAQLTPDKKHFILRILVFFAGSDGIVNENLEKYFDRITAREYKLWRNFQMAMEDIHSIAYSLLLDTYVKDPKEKSRLFHGLENVPTIKKKVDWVHKWLCHTNDLHQLTPETMEALLILKQATLKSYKAGLILESADNPNSLTDLHPAIQQLFHKIDEPRPSLATIIFINVIVEGLFFSGSFCAIFWFQEQGELHALGKLNELISRDEGTHTVFAIAAYNSHLQHKLTQSWAHAIIREAVDIEADFIADSLPKGMLGMNSQMMTQYIRFVADNLLKELNYETLYNVENPFPFMQKQSISVRMSDFFKSVPVEYRLAGANTTANQQTIAGDDEDF